jgi:hypothetical protein
MFHPNKIAANDLPQPSTNLHLVQQAQGPVRPKLAANTSSFADFALIASRRCSSFLAEAAVLVLVFGILDYFMLKGRIELGWIFGALAISLGLLAASIATDFGAQRWIKAHP